MLEKMRPIIAEQLNVQESEIKENTKLKEDLGADSLNLSWRWRRNSAWRFRRRIWNRS